MRGLCLQVGAWEWLWDERARLPVCVRVRLLCPGIFKCLKKQPHVGLKGVGEDVMRLTSALWDVISQHPLELQRRVVKYVYLDWNDRLFFVVPAAHADDTRVSGRLQRGGDRPFGHKPFKLFHAKIY